MIALLARIYNMVLVGFKIINLNPDSSILKRILPNTLQYNTKLNII